MAASWQIASFCVLALMQTGPSPSLPQSSSPQATEIVAESSPPPAGFVRLAANTPINIEIVEALSSKTSVPDQMFTIRLVEPVNVDGVIRLPAGTMGRGQVVHAAKARALGKAGELILAARFLSCGEAHIALRGLHLEQSGKNKATELTAAIAAGGMIAAPLMFVSGGESIVPAGTRAQARLKDAVDVRSDPTAPCTAIPVTVTPVAP